MSSLLMSKNNKEQIITSVWDSLKTGIVIFEEERLIDLNFNAKSLLQISSNENLGPYQESLISLLKTEEDNYSKQLTGVVGKPLTAILHIKNNLKIVEISESYETKLGEAAHELRRPLTNIKTLVDTLYLWGAGEDPEVRKKFLGQLHGQVERLVSMVNDILNLSRMQAGSIPLKFEYIAFKVLVKDSFDLLIEQAKNNNIELICEVSDDFVLIADLDKITHVIQNLIENAIRYNKQNGKVIVKAYENENSFSVIDTGCGIAEENKEKVFERFKRVNKEIAGTGLGLSIVKTIVDLHGGKIELFSELNKGSEFKVSLPKKKLLKMPL